MTFPKNGGSHAAVQPGVGARLTVILQPFFTPLSPLSPHMYRVVEKILGFQKEPSCCKVNTETQLEET
jgi:hypothetical protein